MDLWGGVNGKGLRDAHLEAAVNRRFRAGEIEIGLVCHAGGLIAPVCADLRPQFVRKYARRGSAPAHSAQIAGEVQPPSHSFCMLLAGDGGAG